MPNLRPAEGMGPQGTIDETSLLVGDWPYIGIVDGLKEHELGNAPEGVLEISREEFQHISTAFPRRIDLVVPTSIGMRFSGQLEEFHKPNLHFLVGDAFDTSSNYVYVGDRKDCKFVTFSAKRERACDGRTIEVYMWKVLASGLVQIGTGEPVRTPFEFMAHNDEGGDFGGSAIAPLGYVFVPDKAA